MYFKSTNYHFILGEMYKNTSRGNYKRKRRKIRENDSADVIRKTTRNSRPSVTYNQNLLLMRKQENRLTRISLGIVFLYIVCHIWRMIPTAYEIIFLETDNTFMKNWPFWLVHVYHLSHTLIVTNSAINFLIYVVL